MKRSPTALNGLWCLFGRWERTEQSLTEPYFSHCATRFSLQPAAVNVKTVNLTGQLKNVPMRRIDEADAIYYIGEIAVANRETLIFDISVTPEGVSEASELRFKRQFFTD